MTHLTQAAMRSLVRSMKAKPCADCGVEYPYYIMQFDHVRGTKRFNISTLSQSHSHAWSMTVERAMAEMEKCDVVCANCHAARTWERSKGLDKTD